MTNANKAITTVEGHLQGHSHRDLRSSFGEHDLGCGCWVAGAVHVLDVLSDLLRLAVHRKPIIKGTVGGV